MRRLTVLLISIVLALSGSQFAMAQSGTPGATPDASPAAGCVTTTEAENEAIAHQWFEVWSTKDLQGLDAIMARDYVHHWGMGADVQGRDAFKQSLGDFFTAFPDMKGTLEEIM
ncbi:MAG: nuclear transport factor 2 family protein, partial [Thermomicrobiales bacterium]